MQSAFKSLVCMVAIGSTLMTSGCSLVGVPDARNVDIPSPVMADKRKTAINERPDSVMYLPLGEDVLVPEILENDAFPHEFVGPFELRGETLAGALQLILADYDVSLAFETEEGLNRRVTVANLRGDLGKVVDQVCSLANLYCSFENGSVTVKDTQTFTVTLPPIGTEDETDFLDNVAAGLAAIVGDDVPEPIVDPTTRTIVYSATQRTADIATRYFQRLRANTAMIVFETYIWEVSLNAGNSTGIDWEKIDSFGKFNASFSLDGNVGADFTNPISIGLPTTQDIVGTPADLIQFLSQFGAVKTISQPQITVLSGSSAELRVADTANYVSQIATTLDEGQATTSVNTDSVDTGFTLTINSSWDKATVYAGVDIELTDVKQIDDFTFSDGGDDGSSTVIQLPQTSERQLTTQIRVRPGDSVLIAGLVRENDNFDSRGIGFMRPLIPDSRTAQTQNLELVILLRPRVVIYTASNDKRYIDYAMKKHKLPGTGVEIESPKELGEPPDYKYKTLSVDQPAMIPSGAPQPLSMPVTTEEPEILPPVAPVPVPPVSKGTPLVAPITPAATAAPKTLSPAVTDKPASSFPPQPLVAPRTLSNPAAPVSSVPSSSVPEESRLKSGVTSKADAVTPAPGSVQKSSESQSASSKSVAPVAKAPLIVPDLERAETMPLPPPRTGTAEPVTLEGSEEKNVSIPDMFPSDGNEAPALAVDDSQPVVKNFRVSNGGSSSAPNQDEDFSLRE